MANTLRKVVTSIILCIFLACVKETSGKKCKLEPDNSLRKRTRLDINRYVIEISGNPNAYTPNEKYTILLRSNPELSRIYKFKEFLLAVEPDDSEASVNSFGQSVHPSVGSVELEDDTITKFSKKCQNAVQHTNNLQKSSIQVTWTAPPNDSGCVKFVAYVAESSEVWYAEDGSLMKVICEEVQLDSDIQPRILKRCNACNEAKYELAFQGLWSRNTFPHVFPENEWLTGFTDLIGASHSNNNAFWEYGNFASKGLQEFAERGTTIAIDDELKEKSEEIRTFIRAKGLRYPNTTATTFAVFRVDGKRHLMSIASKIDPSPDWFVGISNLELCTKNGSWIDYIELNLFPWDAGTDNGLGYNFPDEPATVRLPIRQITSSSPNDMRSPFYDSNGGKLKPLAKLYVTRKNIYEKSCEGNVSIEEQEKDENNFDYRIEEEREEIDEEKETRFIPASSEGNEMIATECDLTDWSEWSSCSAKCGTGTRTRDRKFVHPESKNPCNTSSNHLILQENEVCTYFHESCSGTVLPNADDICTKSVWGVWSTCNVTCGTGYKIRFRFPENIQSSDLSDSHLDFCLTINETVKCYEKNCEDPSKNNFDPLDARSQTTQFIHKPVGFVVDCKVSKWSSWSSCSISGTCGYGYKKRSRTIQRPARNGGKACPKNLIENHPCMVPCQEANYQDTTPDYSEANWGPGGSNADIKIDCVMSKWTPWTPCSQECGTEAVQIRTRSILKYPSKNGKPCPSRKDIRKCPLVNACGVYYD